jgi:HEPN domain-containing protein
MEREEIIQYWLDTADNDFHTMTHLFDSGDFPWALFMGHLVIEKLLKALYVKEIDINPPRIHDLLRLAEKTSLPLNDEIKDTLDLISSFNISVRYPDYKRSFYRKCTNEYTEKIINIIKELRTWILSVIRKT